ncbi:hypothetical protein [uncultured Vibrio sp.]|uniref:hypothetical protein n=1 Tax=uncultured Vibrio sp. TaxID=114054 RepID=UPI0025F13129|nr:hypothetical protein [uncultured Vibrio sp.]
MNFGAHKHNKNNASARGNKLRLFKRFTQSVGFPVLLVTGFELCADESDLEIQTIPSLPPVENTVFIPIIGAMESTGLLAGSVVSVTGVGQRQAQAVAFGAYSVNDSYISYLGYFNYGLSERWALDISALQAEFTDTGFFIGERTNDASNNTSHLQRDVLMTFRYLLSEEEAKTSYPAMQHSLTANSSSIRTVFEIEPFYRSRDFISPDIENVEGVTYGVSMKLDRDARNYAPSANNGYYSYARIIGDWGNSTRASYTRWEAQHTQYLDLGSNPWSHQQTLSLTGYLSDIPTWRNSVSSSQPAWFAQSTLGGPDRMRGYGDNYFHNRSALFYGSEYRLIPSWQPQVTAPLLKHYNFPWWQFAVFAELGNVEDKFDMVELHKNVQWSSGLGVRVFIENIVARADFALSKDDSILRFTVNQAF